MKYRFLNWTDKLINDSAKWEYCFRSYLEVNFKIRWASKTTLSKIGTDSKKILNKETGIFIKGLGNNRTGYVDTWELDENF